MNAGRVAGVSAAVAVPAVVIVVLAVVAALGGGLAGSLPGSATLACRASGATATTVAGYSADQLANAATIVAVGKQMNVPPQGQVIAIAAALQESELRNLDYGDRDSLGLFQQRPSQGWGTPAQLTDPAYAAAQFYRALLAIPGWQQLSLTDAAQAVQRSAFPDAYAKHEPAALAITAAVGGATCAPTGPPTPVLARAIAFAYGQIGQPYVWGGNGPESTDQPGRASGGGFDCSGLTTAAYAAAGIALPRTAHTQYQATARVSPADLQPGDLVFYGNPATKIHHVGLYIGNGQMIDAPQAGELVGIHPIDYPGSDLVGGGRVAGRSAPRPAPG